MQFHLGLQVICSFQPELGEYRSVTGYVLKKKNQNQPQENVFANFFILLNLFLICYRVGKIVVVVFSSCSIYLLLTMFYFIL